MSIASPVAGDTKLVKPPFSYVDVRPNGLRAPEITQLVGWNASATAYAQLAAAGTVSFLCAATCVGAIVGISAGVAQDYGQATHAIYVTRGVAQALQSGALIGSTTTFTDTDVLSIVVAAGVVTYKKNSTTFYTSAVAATGTVHYVSAFLFAANDAVYNLTVTSSGGSTPHGDISITTRQACMLAGDHVGYAALKATTSAAKMYASSGTLLTPKYGGVMFDTAPAAMTAVGFPLHILGYLKSHRVAGMVGANVASYGYARLTTALPLFHATVGLRLDSAMFEMLGVTDTYNRNAQVLVSIISSLRFNELAVGMVVIPKSIIENLSVSDDLHFVRILKSIIDTLSATDTTAVVTALVESIISQLGGSHQLLAQQTLHAAILGRVRARAADNLVGATVPHETWAVNTEKTNAVPGRPSTNQSTRYGNFDFNSFCNLGGVAYGARADGVYVLEGDDDDGDPIRASLNFGKAKFGTSDRKRVPAAYVGTSSSGQLFLKVTAEGQTYLYQARSFDENMAVQRFDLGKGLRANYIEFELFNGPGFPFDMDSIEFMPVPLSRKI